MSAGNRPRTPPQHAALEVRPAQSRAIETTIRPRRGRAQPRSPARSWRPSTCRTRGRGAARRRRRPAPRRPRARSRPRRSARRSKRPATVAIASRPSSPATTACARLVLGDLGLQRGHLALAHVGQIGDDEVEPPRPAARSRARSRPDRRARAGRAFSRASASASREVSVATTSAPGSSSATASATAPDPVPTSSTRLRLELDRDLDQELGLRPRDQRAAVDRELQCGEIPCGPGCRPPARGGPAAGPSRRTRARRRQSTPTLRLGGQPRAVAARRLARAAARRPGAASRPPRPRTRRSPPRAPRATLPAIAGRLIGTSAVCASRRARFSSAPSATVNSLRSPARTSSRLCAVSLIRWSVTRPCGKL